MKLILLFLCKLCCFIVYVSKVYSSYHVHLINSKYAIFIKNFGALQRCKVQIHLWYGFEVCNVVVQRIF